MSELDWIFVAPFGTVENFRTAIGLFTMIVMGIIIVLMFRKIEQKNDEIAKLKDKLYLENPFKYYRLKQRK